MTTKANISDAWDYRTRGKVEFTFSRFVYSDDETEWQLKITPDKYHDTYYSMTVKVGGLDEIIGKFQEAYDHLSKSL